MVKTVIVHKLDVISLKEKKTKVTDTNKTGGILKIRK